MKKGSAVLWVSLILLAVLLVGIFGYFALYSPNYNSTYVERVNSGELVNPVSGLSTEEAISQFNEKFIYYLLYSIEAYNLHNPPLSKDTAKLVVYIDDDIYNVEVANGEIYVGKGEIVKRDLIIRTTKEEAVKMLQDNNYIKESFSSEKSIIELLEDKSTLFAKGYLTLYKELTGKSITGSVVRIYAD